MIAFNCTCQGLKQQTRGEEMVNNKPWEHSAPWIQFLSFIEERAAIAYKKEVLGMPPPWTNDPVLANGKFGNVWRELDRGTRWELEQLAEANKLTRNSMEAQLALILVYRHNLIPATTAGLLNELLNPDGLVAASDGRQLFNDVIKVYPEWGAGWQAGCMCPRIYADANPKDWATYACLHLQDVVCWMPNLMQEVQLLERRLIGPCDFHDTLQHLFPRLGSFKAYEVMTSLTYLDWWTLTEDDFPHVGPGALPALVRLMLELEVDQLDITKPERALALLLPLVHDGLRERSQMTWWYQAPELNWQHYPDGKFTLRTLEDCLCEWRKYHEVRVGKRINRPYPDTLGRWD
jgi:hypothetical protein